MNASAARMLVLSGAGAWRRLAGIVAGVGLGVAMLLILLGAYVHMPDRDDRAAWITASNAVSMVAGDGTPIAPDAAGGDVLHTSGLGFVRDKVISVAYTAASTSSTVEGPAGLTPPAAGTFYASPALAELIDSLPGDQLGDRYGELVGELPDAVLKGPDHLVAWVGVTWEQAERAGASPLSEYPSDGKHYESTTYQVILAVGAIALLVPIVLLIAIVSHLGATQRRERFATVRLIGAGRRAVATLSAAEMGIASLAGGVVGVGFAAALRPAAQLISISGTQSFAADLTPSWSLTAMVVVGVGLLGAAASGWRAFRDDVGAPGASREVAEKRVRAWRLVPLLVGLAAFSGSAWGMANGSNDYVDTLVLTFLGGFALTAFGIVYAGPWLTALAARVARRGARRAPSLVAAGRLARHPRATFRSVGGLVVAVFIVSVFAGSVSSVADAVAPRERDGLLPLDALLVAVDGADGALRVMHEASAVDGVTDVAPLTWVGEGRAVATREAAALAGAADLPDSEYVEIELSLMSRDSGTDDEIWPDAAQPATRPAAEPDVVLIRTDGTTEAIDRARTAAYQASGAVEPASGRGDLTAVDTLDVTSELAVMAYIGMAIAIGISALSLTVATVAAALDRKRTFGLLRLSGMPVAHLRRTVAVEASMPLGATLLLSAGLGFAVAWVIISTLGNNLSMGWPEPAYWWSLLLSAAIAGIGVFGGFGAVRRSTEVESTRFE